MNSHLVFLVAQMVGNLPSMQETWVRKITWRREQQPTPVFWPGEFHGQRSLAGYSPLGPRELDMTERLSLFVDYQIFLHLFNKGNIINSAVKIRLHLCICLFLC